MGKKVVEEVKNTVTVRVDYYRNNSERKTNKPFGVFTVEVTPREVKPINTELEGDKLEKDKIRFAEETDKADLALRTDALDEVHKVVGWGPNVLVANIVPEEEKEDK